MTWLLLLVVDRPCSVTAYALQDDALRTGELDYISGGNPAKTSKTISVSPGSDGW
jgi:hypothetical protein